MPNANGIKQLKKILIVEDEGVVALDLRRKLVRLGYLVPAIASTGEEAVKNAQETQPDLVLMDIMLYGEMGGIIAAEYIYKHFDIPIVFLTAYSDEDTLQRAKIAEPYGYILKPFEDRELYIAIEIALYKHNMERELQENKKWFEITLRSILEAVIATDGQGLINFMNPVAEDLLGWKLEEISGSKLTEVYNIIDSETRQHTENPVTSILREGVAVGPVNNSILVTRDGMEILIEHSAAPIRNDQENIIGLVLVFRDITQRERMGQALKESEGRYRALADKLREVDLHQSEDRFYKIFNNSPDMIAILKMSDNKIVEVNQSYLDNLGFAPDEVIGHSPVGLGILSQDDWVGLQRLGEQLPEQGGIVNQELDIRAKSGKTIRTMASLSVIKLDDADCWLTTLKDISEKKHFEQELARLERLNLIGAIAAGIAHEVRNPITVVKGYLELLKKKTELASYQDHLTTMLDEIDRINLIISEFLSLSKNTAIYKKKHFLNDIVSALLPMIKADAGKNGIVVNAILEEVPELLLDEKQIRQVILNLVRNGLEAMADKGVLTIKTCLDGDSVVLAVKDQGEGIAPEVLNKIGTPFFSTKEKGTGLGLAVCHRIAEDNHARIEIETGREGSTFKVCFPLESKIEVIS
ncbi:MAG: PAS domain S-box protein [Firmicutes bacterium]|nr:PAS domain S-box protein [Bacillota bacterium]